MNRRTLRIRARPTLLALVVVVAFTACSSDGGAGGPTPSPAGTTTAADERANLTIIGQDALPEGWRRVPAKDRVSGSPGTATYCGVVAEPDPVREGRISYYEQASLPRAMLEYGMVSTTAAATRTLDALIARRDNCSEPGASYEPVDLRVGDQSIVWDVSRADRPGFRVMVFRRSDTVVALVAFGDAGVPEQQQLEIARAIDARLAAGT